MVGKTLTSGWQKVLAAWPELPGTLIIAALMGAAFILMAALGVQP